MAYVYSHTRLDTNEVFYIGIGSVENYKRAHVTGNRTKHWKRLVNKAGYKVDILSDNLTWEEACLEEKRLIKHYGRKDLKEGNLINKTDGGDGTSGALFTEERRKKISDAGKGRKVSDETRRKQSEYAKANPVFKGKTHSEESKKKIGDANRGRPNPYKGVERSDEIKRNISEATKGRTFSDEHRKNISEAHKLRGTKPPVFRKHSEESKRKISETHKSKRKLQQPVPHTFF